MLYWALLVFLMKNIATSGDDKIQKLSCHIDKIPKQSQLSTVAPIISIYWKAPKRLRVPPEIHWQPTHECLAVPTRSAYYYTIVLLKVILFKKGIFMVKRPKPLQRIAVWQGLSVQPACVSGECKKRSELPKWQDRASSQHRWKVGWIMMNSPDNRCSCQRKTPGDDSTTKIMVWLIHLPFVQNSKGNSRDLEQKWLQATWMKEIELENHLATESIIDSK